MDISYNDDGLYTSFFPETLEGEDAVNDLMTQNEGSNKVLSIYAKSVILQLRKAGYSVRKKVHKKIKESDAELLAALGLQVSPLPVVVNRNKKLFKKKIKRMITDFKIDKTCKGTKTTYPILCNGRLDLNEVRSVSIHFHEGHPYIKENSIFPSLAAAHQAIAYCFQYQIDQGGFVYDKLCFTIHFEDKTKDLTSRIHLGFENENPLTCKNVIVDYLQKKDLAWHKWKKSCQMTIA